MLYNAILNNLYFAFCWYLKLNIGKYDKPKLLKNINERMKNVYVRT